MAPCCFTTSLDVLFMTWPSAGQVDLLQISRTRFGHPSGWFVEMGKWTEMDVLKKHEKAQSPLLGFLAVWDWETLHDHIRWPSIRGACPARCEISNDQSVHAACCTWTVLLFSHTHTHFWYYLIFNIPTCLLKKGPSTFEAGMMKFKTRITKLDYGSTMMNPNPSMKRMVGLLSWTSNL